MTPAVNNLELQRHRAILLATLDYLHDHLGGSFVYDQYDPIAEYYRQQKIKTEKYCKQQRLEKLQQQLNSLTEGLQNKVDLNFSIYIKERTGYDIDIFGDLRIRVKAIVEQKQIRSQKELSDIGTMLNFLHRTAANEEQIEKLRQLLTDYAKRPNEISRKTKDKYSKVVAQVEKDGSENVTVRVSTGPTPKHFEEQDETSPDGRLRLRVIQWDDGKHGSTYVTVEFPTASSAVYALSGIYDVKARWKDNSTIVIETQKEHTTNTQHKQVKSFDDVVNIEYIERK